RVRYAARGLARRVDPNGAEAVGQVYTHNHGVGRVELQIRRHLRRGAAGYGAIADANAIITQGGVVGGNKHTAKEIKDRVVLEMRDVSAGCSRQVGTIARITDI